MFQVVDLTGHDGGSAYEESKKSVGEFGQELRSCS